MPKNNQKEENIFCSIDDIDRKYFPTYYNKKIEDKKFKESGAFGINLAVELLEDLKKQLQQ